MEGQWFNINLQTFIQGRVKVLVHFSNSRFPIPKDFLRVGSRKEYIWSKAVTPPIKIAARKCSQVLAHDVFHFLYFNRSDLNHCGFHICFIFPDVIWLIRESATT